jgi:hypothetical protein
MIVEKLQSAVTFQTSLYISSRRGGVTIFGKKPHC